jgi:hypothetical protein
LSWVFKQRGSGMAMATDEVGAENSRFDNFIGPTLTIGKFSNSAGGSIAGDLNLGHYRKGIETDDRQLGRCE